MTSDATLLDWIEEHQCDLVCVPQPNATAADFSERWEVIQRKTRGAPVSLGQGPTVRAAVIEAMLAGEIFP